MKSKRFGAMLICIAACCSLAVILTAVSGSRVYAQTTFINPLSNGNQPIGRNSNYPPYNVVPGTSQSPQHVIRPGTMNQTTGVYGRTFYPGGVYPGYPSNYTYIQPQPTGGYYLGNYGYDTGALPPAYTVGAGASGYVVIDEGAVQDILPVNSGITSVDGYADQQSAPAENNEYNYTVNNYYVSSTPSGTDQTTPDTAPQTAPSLVPSPMPPQTDPTSTVQGYDLALGDIQQAWSTGDFSLMQKYLPNSSGTVKVSAGGQTPGAVSVGQLTQMTESAFAKLTTYSFVITAVRKQADGSVTGYITHTYAPAGISSGKRSTIYWAYTLVNTGGNWTISEIDSSTSPLGVVGSGLVISTPPVVNQASASTVRGS